MKNSENKTILDYETVDFNKEENCLVIIDQTLLPGKTEIIQLKTAQEIWDAIYLLKVRGAPAIGVAAAFGIYQLSFEIWKNRKDISYEEFEKQFLEQKEFLKEQYPHIRFSPYLKALAKEIVAELVDEELAAAYARGDEAALPLNRRTYARIGDGIARSGPLGDGVDAEKIERAVERGVAAMGFYISGKKVATATRSERDKSDGRARALARRGVDR